MPGKIWLPSFAEAESALDFTWMIQEGGFVLVRCGKFLVVLALVANIGAHWAALQTVAWATMLATNLRNESVSEAVCQTFDGKHPCCLCKAIAAAKKSGKKSESLTTGTKLEFPPLAVQISLTSPARFAILQPDNFSAILISYQPPVPPPRLCFA